MAHIEVFEAFFLQADLDCDGVISGPEAINFFKAIDLSQPTLAKIWKFVDEGQRGFLSRQEFYNALKLVTIAQTGRELTPELVKVALKGASASQIPPPCMTSIQPFPNIPKTNNHFTNQNKESKGAILATLIDSHKSICQVVDSNKKMLSQKEKTEYYLSKFQEIELFKSQCDDKFAKMMEKVIASKHEVHSLNQQCDLTSKSASEVEILINMEHDNLKNIEEKKTKISSILSKLNNKSLVPRLDAQTQLHLIVVDLFKLKRMLVHKAKTLGVDIKQESPKNLPFGCIQVQKSSNSILEQPNLTIFDKELSTKFSKNENKEIALNLNISNCFFQSALPTNYSSIIESSNNVNISETTNEDLIKNSIQIKTSDGLKCANQTLINNVKQNESNSKSLVLAKTSTKEVNINSKTKLEFATKVSTIIEENNSTHNFHALRPHFEGDKGFVMMNESINANNSLNGVIPMVSNIQKNIISPWKVIQVDNAHLVPQTLRGFQSNSQSISQILGGIKMSKSRGSFQPEDYFDFTLPYDLNIEPPCSKDSTMAYEEHIKTNDNHQENCPNYLQLQK